MIGAKESKFSEGKAHFFKFFGVSDTFLGVSWSVLGAFIALDLWASVKFLIKFWNFNKFENFIKF